MSRRRTRTITDLKLDAYVLGTFREHISTLITPIVGSYVKAVAAEEYAKQSILRAAVFNYNAEHKANVKLTPSIEKTEFSIRLAHDALGVRQGYSGLPFDMSAIVTVEHHELYGENQLSMFPKARWAESREMRLVQYGETYQIEPGGMTLDHDAAESIRNSIDYSLVVKNQLNLWLSQFGGAGKEDRSIAAYYSSAIKLWLHSVGMSDKIRTYITRPRFPYETPMSPELNTALTIAYQLRQQQEQQNKGA